MSEDKKREDEIKKQIAYDIIFGGQIGEILKRWRLAFEIKQTELAKFLKMKQSVISDVENNKRKNPGIKFVKKYIDALIEIDRLRDYKIIRRYTEILSSEYFERRNFYNSITIRELIKLLDAKVYGYSENLDTKIYGYTIVDSIRVILNLALEDFLLLYGGIADRAMIFLGVSTGRSPMVVIRVAPVKPKVVVFLNLENVDPLAIKIAEREKIPILVTNMELSKIKEILEKI